MAVKIFTGIGVIVGVAFMLLITLNAVIALLNYGGKYTIGAVPNSLFTRAFAVAVFLGVIYAWYPFLHHLPLDIVFKP